MVLQGERNSQRLGQVVHGLDERHQRAPPYVPQKGGSDLPSNLELIHTQCHRQVHAGDRKMSS
ncbi:HNH endonuclease [Kitasatospora sp. NPDC001175]|uniref:HNH endonuclease n=1 Tax=Kitasatospora sp. NPDC001175 TaxID=3157103 RepID=UPI003D089350